MNWELRVYLDCPLRVSNQNVCHCRHRPAPGGFFTLIAPFCRLFREQTMIQIHELKTMSKVDLDKLMIRANVDINEVKASVKKIIHAVRTEGDNALVRFTKEWDEPDYDISQLVVTKAQIDEAYKNTPQETIDKIKEQIELARKFHEIQRKQILDWQTEIEKGIVVGEKWTAIDE